MPSASIDTSDDLEVGRSRGYIQSADTEQVLAPPSTFAKVPRLASNLGLDETGQFVEHAEPLRFSSSSHLSMREDMAMDRKRDMTFLEIDSREKRAIYSLPVVKRAMRECPGPPNNVAKGPGATLRQRSAPLVQNARAARVHIPPPLCSHVCVGALCSHMCLGALCSHVCVARPSLILLAHAGHLQYSNILMSDEVLMTSKTFMEVGPSRASLFNIGWDAISLGGSDRSTGTFQKDIAFISPWLRRLQRFVGYSRVSLPLVVAAFACEFLYCALHIKDYGPELISITTCITTSVICVVLIDTALEEIRSTARNDRPYRWGAVAEGKKKKESYEECYLGGYLVVGLHGMDVLATAQERNAKELKHLVTKEDSIRSLKKRIVDETVRECATLHLLPALIPFVLSTTVTAYRRLQEGNTLMGVLAIGATFSKLISQGMFVEGLFYLRLQQRLLLFEVRRVQCDVRICPTSLIHRVTPRFKALLQEAHMQGNKGHFIFYMMIPFISIYGLQMVGGVFARTNESACIPTWTFFAIFQPMISLAMTVHGYSKLNLAIERDVDQDIVEMVSPRTCQHGRVCGPLCSHRLLPLLTQKFVVTEHPPHVLGLPRAQLAASAGKWRERGHTHRGRREPFGEGFEDWRMINANTGAPLFTPPPVLCTRACGRVF